jgi:hypothetical protein
VKLCTSIESRCTFTVYVHNFKVATVRNSEVLSDKLNEIGTLLVGIMYRNGSVKCRTTNSYFLLISPENIKQLFALRGLISATRKILEVCTKLC